MRLKSIKFRGIEPAHLERIIQAQYHGLWPCNPERPGRSGVQLVKRKLDEGRNDSSGSGSQSVFDRISTGSGSATTSA
jgi:hypothetical protein